MIALEAGPSIVFKLTANDCEILEDVFISFIFQKHVDDVDDASRDYRRWAEAVWRRGRRTHVDFVIHD